MYSELLGYDDIQKKGFICNDEMKIEIEYSIGEAFVDFMELDFSAFEIFYDDIEKMYKKSFSTKHANTDMKKTYLDKKNITLFFAKYPLLKKEIINDMLNIRKKWYGDFLPSNINYSVFDSLFTVDTPSVSPDFFELSELFSNVNEATVYDLLINALADTLNNVHNINEFTWKSIYKFKNPYICNLDHLLVHPYIQLLNDDDSDDSIVEHLFPHILQRQYWEAFIFCFDVDLHPSLNHLTAEKRLYLFNELHPYNHIKFQDIKSEFVINNANSIVSFTNVYNSDHNEKNFIDWFKEHADSVPISNLLEQNICRFQLYETYNLNNIMEIEFQKMIEHNVKIKKCKHCGKYFVLKGDYGTDYCDRILTGEKFTCKKLAAIQARKAKVNSNPILKEYERAYKRNYARVSNHRMTHEEFRLWTEEAIQNRDDFSARYSESPSELLISEFKCYLGNK